MDLDLVAPVLRAGLLDRAQHVQAGVLGAADVAGAVAVRAGHEAGLGERGAQSLAAHLEQAEAADRAELDAGAVVLQRLLDALLDGGVVASGLHVDEVDDDQAGEVAQPELSGHLVGGLQVGAQRRLLDAALLGGAAGVDVDRDQGLGLVDDQVAAGLELHGGREHGVELGLDALAGEQRLAGGVLPELHLAGVRGHQQAHVVARGAPALLAVDQDVVHVARVDVADGALDEAGFLVDQRRRHRAHRGVADVVPQAQQVVAVAGDLGLGAGGAGGADDHAHAARQVEFGGDLLEAAAVGGGGDLARHAAAAGRVRHQHGEAAGERDEGGERRALRAALLLDHLDQQDLAAADDVLDLVVAQVAGLRALVAAVLAGVRPLAGGGGACGLGRGRGGAGIRKVVGSVLQRLGGGVVVERGDGLLGGVRVGGWRRVRIDGAGVDVVRVGGGCLAGGAVPLVGADGEGQGGGLLLAVRQGGEDVRGIVGCAGGAALVAAVSGVIVRVGSVGVGRRVALAAAASFGGLGRGVVGGCLRAGILLLHRDDALPVGDGDLVVVGVDLAEGQEAVAVAAILDEGGLEAGLHADDLGEVDVALELALGGGLDVEVLETATVENHDAGFFPVACVDQHAFGHEAWISDAPARQHPVGVRRRAGSMSWVRKKRGPWPMRARHHPDNASAAVRSGSWCAWARAVSRSGRPGACAPRPDEEWERGRPRQHRSVVVDSGGSSHREPSGLLSHARRSAGLATACSCTQRVR